MTATICEHVTTEEFRNHIQEVSLRLFNENSFLPPDEDASLLAMMEFGSRQEEVFDLAYTEKPYLFDGIEWINSELGVPLWVKPGAIWEAD